MREIQSGDEDVSTSDIYSETMSVKSSSENESEIEDCADEDLLFSGASHSQEILAHP